ncbi:MAG: hypothetical protein R2941_17155 [Desulfobacterales bacterium]
MELCSFVRECIKQFNSCGKTPDRNSAFQHESGIHCHALLRDSRTYEPFPSKLSDGEKGNLF